MKHSIAILTVILLAGCASSQGSSRSDALEDFIVVSELKELEKVRLHEPNDYTSVSDRYDILKTRKNFYLIEFRHLCREPTGGRVRPDIRYDKNVLRPGIDTIRGCRIGRIFAIDEVQAQELEHLGKAPGD